jgi:hypothetical protein
MTQQEYIKKQKAEMFDDKNKHWTGENVGHDPSPEEMVWNYIEKGGAKTFCDTYGHLVDDSC